MAGRGRAFGFHGAFSNKTDAVKKERALKGAGESPFIQRRKVRGQVRFIVMTAEKPSQRYDPLRGIL